MSQVFLVLGGVILIVLGVVHGSLTVRDLAAPRFFTPVDGVRRQMSGVALRLHPDIDLWRAWLGFNLSHSLGLLVSGTAAVWLGWAHPAIYVDGLGPRLVPVAVAIVYLGLAMRFWFWAPVVGCSAALACFVVAALAG